MKRTWLKWLLVAVGTVGILVLVLFVYAIGFTHAGKVAFRDVLPKVISSYVSYCRDDQEIENMLGQTPAIVPFSVSPQGLILMKAKIKNHTKFKELQFILDSGAAVVTVVHPIGATLPLVIPHTHNTWAMGVADVAVVEVPELDLGSIRIHNNIAVTACLPTCTISPFFGMIGNSVLDHFTVTIDNEAHNVILACPQHFKPSAEADVVKLVPRLLPWVPVLIPQSPYVRCKVNGRAAILLVDSGSETSLIREDYLNDSSAKQNTVVVGPVTVVDLSLQKNTWKGLPERVDGALGEDFIRSFKRVTIDLRSRRLLLEPYSGGKLDDSECLLNKGWYELRRGRSEQAIVQFNRLINEGRPDYRAFWLRGQCEHDQKKAIEDFSTSIKMCGDFAVAYAERGKCYAKYGAYAKALDDLTTAIKIYTAEPEMKRPEYGWDAEPFIWRGWVYERIDKKQDALNDYSTAISINPKSSYAHSARARVYDLLGQHDRASIDREKPIDQHKSG